MPPPTGGGLLLAGKGSTGVIVPVFGGVVFEQQQELPTRKFGGAIAGVEKALVVLATTDPQPGQLAPQLGGGISQGILGHDHLKAGAIGHRHYTAQRIERDRSVIIHKDQHYLS
jgi:hypothetical protein